MDVGWLQLHVVDVMRRVYDFNGQCGVNLVGNMLVGDMLDVGGGLSGDW